MPRAGQMLHQAQEEGQVVRPDPLFIKREDEGAAVGLEIEIGILHPFGDALEGQRRADIVAGEQALQILETDIGIDRHDAPTLCPNRLLPLGGVAG